MYEEGNDLDFDMGQWPLHCPAQPDIPADAPVAQSQIATGKQRSQQGTERGINETCGYMTHSIGGYECSMLTVFPRLAVPLPLLVNLSLVSLVSYVSSSPGLYFFEQLNKFFSEEPGSTPPVLVGLNGYKWNLEYPKSVPEQQTAVVRKKELRDKVDVNFDGRVSFLEYLLYQYKASPKDLMDRQSPVAQGTPPEVLAAIAALAEVNKRVKEYEAEKARLEDLAEHGTGIKSPKAKNELAQLTSSPLWEQINKALITAEAALRIAQKKYGAGSGVSDGSGGAPRVNGTMWWLDRSEQRTYAQRSKQTLALRTGGLLWSLDAKLMCLFGGLFFRFPLFSELKTKKERYGPKAK